MEKIVIIGSSGSGKTTFAKTLGQMLGIKVFHLDRVFWKAGWKRKTRYERMETVDELVRREKRWIIEGAYPRSSDARLEAADTIIFLDLFPLLCLGRVIKRHYNDHGNRRDIPEGCTDKLTFIRMLKVLFFPIDDLLDIKQILHYYGDKQIIWLRSPREVEKFLNTLRTGLTPRARPGWQ